MLFASLLEGKKEFEGFLSMVNAEYIREGIPELIKELYTGKICRHADLDMLIGQYPCGLAYALALIDTTDYRSVTPGWVLHNYPEVEFIVKLLRHTNCLEGCDYCHTQLDVPVFISVRERGVLGRQRDGTASFWVRTSA